MDWNRVWAAGRDSYIRIYPNPGIGLRLGKKRIALSWRGGLEIFRAHPRVVWQRTWSFGSRVKRPLARG